MNARRDYRDDDSYDDGRRSTIGGGGGCGGVDGGGGGVTGVSIDGVRTAGTGGGGGGGTIDGDDDAAADPSSSVAGGGSGPCSALNSDHGHSVGGSTSDYTVARSRGRRRRERRNESGSRGGGGRSGSGSGGRHEIAWRQRKRARFLLAGLVAGLSLMIVLQNEMSAPLLYNTLRGNTDIYRYSTLRSNAAARVYIPPSLDPDRQRHLSLNLGGGDCLWKPPTYDVPEDIDFYKTLIAGFPSGDKRMVYLQMEALSGWPAKDEWDFQGMGMTNHPFIKANYPHHEGIWGWGRAADQVVMMVPNIRRSMVEYHDILWDLGYATRWEDTLLLRDNLFLGQPDLDDYYEWRDSRVMDEAHWYGWFIDYWMEGGLMRDIYSHRLTTPEHWMDLVLKPFYTRKEMAYENYVANDAVVEPAYDPHCASVGGDITGGCEPVAVISADKLLDYTEGPAETQTIGSVLSSDPKTGQFVIDPEAWDCIWTELIQNKKGPRIITDRPGYENIYKKDTGYNFSAEMLTEMLSELNRLIEKYGSGTWATKPVAMRLVEILEGHRSEIEFELHEVNTGIRNLKAVDYLGPEARRNLAPMRRRGRDEQEKAVTTNYADSSSASSALSMEFFAREKKSNLRYFIALEQKRFENRRRDLMGEELAKAAVRTKRRRKEGADIDADSLMSDGEFIEILTGAITEARTLEALGKIDMEAAKDLIDRIRNLAVEAKVGLGE